MQQWQSRRNSQTLPAGAWGQTHRVTRRKSMSAANAGHLAAVVAAAAQSGSEPMPTRHRTMTTTTTTTTTTARRSVLVRAVADQAAVNMTAHPNHIADGVEADRGWPPGAPSDASSLADLDRPRSKAGGAGQPSPRWMPPSTARSGPKLRSRRASEGSQLRTAAAAAAAAAAGRRESGNELRCETCGKAYKHSSCLIKHLCVPGATFARPIPRLLGPNC